MSQPATAELDHNRAYTIPETCPYLGCSEWSAREIIVNRQLIAHFRHAERGQVYVRGADLAEYLSRIRQPAVGERGRRAAQAAVAGK